jgi:nitrogen fixation protein FixH
MTMREHDTDYRPGGSPWTGRKMLLAMLAFFGVIIAVNLTMAFLAVKDFRGTIVDSGYVASQDFNADRKRLEAQKARGWKIEASHAGGAPLMRFSQPDGRPITGLALTVRAMRTADQRADRSLTLVETGPGLYAANEALDPGQWRLAFIAEGEGPRYAHVIDLFVRPGN